jgi:mercuric ion transport protein
LTHSATPVRELACLPSAIPAAERPAHCSLAKELFHSRAQERKELSDGYAIRFANDAFEAVARFVANERKCCPFMRFELTVAPETGPLWLRMTGPQGTRDVLQAELNLRESCCQRVVKWTTAGGILAALGVCAACCLLPFALLSLGVAGAWVSGLDALASYKWLFIVATLAFLGHGFYAVYWKPSRQCAAGAAYEGCGSSRATRVGLWIATALAISGIVFERIEPLLRN